MTSSSVSIYTQGGGTASSASFPSSPFRAARDPGTTDVRGSFGVFPVGQEWINTSSNSVFSLTSFSASAGVVSATWVALGGGSSSVGSLAGNTGTATPTAGSIAIVGTGDVSTTASGSTITIAVTPSTGVVSTLTGGSGGALSPTGGNISILGTANQITSAGSGSTITLSMPSAVLTPGSLTTTTSLTATLGNIVATNGSLSLGTAGNKIVIATGSNASVGVSGVMSGTPGTVTVATTACSATTLVFFSRKTAGGSLGDVSISAQDGTGFTLTSSANETSTFNWWIINA